MSTYKKINKCRICGSKRLIQILDLGDQALTGVFPKIEDDVIVTPTAVVKCDHCHLVQMKYTTNLNLMYGETYGYESSLNNSMVTHLKTIAKDIESYIQLSKGDIICDIGSNDGTFLNFFDNKEYYLLGIDPSAGKFKENYKGIRLEPDFFSESAFRKYFPKRSAKVITSIACFYDLEEPVKFAQETANILHEDGVWMMEMAYLPAVIENLAFDGYCQEHLLYYSLRDIKYIMDRVGLKIVDVKFNGINGGSFQVVVKHTASVTQEYSGLSMLLERESFLQGLKIHLDFEKRVGRFKRDFRILLSDLVEDGNKVYGLGASTKFNVVLQYCNIGTELIPKIGEVNDFKFGLVTPGTNIPIVPEKEVLELNPDYLVVGPYHFRDTFIKVFDGFLDRGGKLIFPLPNLEVYSKD